VSNLRLLWVESASGIQSAELRDEARALFNVTQVPLGALVAEHISEVRPNVICFDFDRPSPHDLHLLRDVKRAYPSTPVLMLTREHSEGLAVWAFRSRVWNYLTKPVSLREFRSNLGTLRDIFRESETADRGPRESRKPYALGALIPSESPSASIDALGARLAPATAYIDGKLADDIRQSKAAALCGMSPSQFSRAFHARFGIAFRQYVIRHRISIACLLLRDTRKSVLSIAHETGFCDAAHFSRTFKQRVGMVPLEYRNLHAPQAKSRAVGKAKLPAPLPIASAGPRLAMRAGPSR
jgi:AraC-like DNA-binding protein